MSQTRSKKNLGNLPLNMLEQADNTEGNNVASTSAKSTSAPPTIEKPRPKQSKTSTGPMAPESNYLNYTTPKDISTYSGIPEEYNAFTLAFIYSLRVATYDRIILNVNDDKVYSEKDEAFIFQCLYKALDKKNFKKIEVRFENKGSAAFKFLDISIRGTLEQRYQATLLQSTQLKLSHNDDIDDYIPKLAKLDRDLITHGISSYDNNGSIPSMISFSLSNLPARFDLWQQNMRDRYAQTVWPTVDRYIEDLMTADRRLKNESKQRDENSLRSINVIRPTQSKGALNRQRRARKRAAAAASVTEELNVYKNGNANRGNKKWNRGSRGRGGFNRNRGTGNDYQPRPYNAPQNTGYTGTPHTTQPRQNVSKNNYKSCLFCNSTGSHSSKECRRKKCNYCWDPSHVEHNCPSKNQ